MGKGGKRKGNDGSRDRSGGGRGGWRGGGHDTRLSKLLSLVLRHKAVELGLPIAPDGYVPLADLLALPRFAAVGATEAAVRRVAEDNDKQRFSLATDAAGVVRVRANQGHTMACVESEALLERIVTGEGGDPPVACVCVHGTALRNWGAIKKSGLSRMERNHIHFARGLPGEDGVISGMVREEGACTAVV